MAFEPSARGGGLLVACGTERAAPEGAAAPDSLVAAPDSLAVRRALTDERVRDSLMEDMPGGAMARGDSAAMRRLLERKR